MFVQICKQLKYTELPINTLLVFKYFTLLRAPRGTSLGVSPPPLQKGRPFPPKKWAGPWGWGGSRWTLGGGRSCRPSLTHSPHLYIQLSLWSNQPHCLPDCLSIPGPTDVSICQYVCLSVCQSICLLKKD